MSFQFTITPALAKQIDKLWRRDKILALAIRKKITQIINGDIIFINHFKNLRHDLSNYKRVHIGSFVLIFKVEKDMIIFDKFCHHDQAY